MMGWHNDGSMGTGGWIAMVLLMSLFWGAVIFAGAAVVAADGSALTAGASVRTSSGAVGLQLEASPPLLHTPEISALPSGETATVI